MREGSVHRYKAAIFGLAALAVVLTAGAAVLYWLPPWGPLLAFGLLGGGPLLFWATLGAIVFDPTKTRDGIVSRDSPHLGKRLRMALAPVVLALLLGALLTGSWFLAPVRVLAAEFGASQRLAESLDAAMMDGDAEVRLAACQGLAGMGDQISGVLVGALIDPSNEVVRCALGAIPVFDQPPFHLHVVSSRWDNELMTMSDGSDAGDRACDLADRLRTVERKGLKQASGSLMRCALDAKSAPARDCCSQAFRALLGGADVEPSMVLGPPVELVASTFKDSLPSLLEATFGDDPAAEQRRTALRLGTPQSAAWALALGCEALVSGGAASREDISGAMASALSSEQCRLSPATEGTVRIWTAVCSQVLSAETVAAATGAEGELLCLGVSRALMADAANEAQHEVSRALRLARAPNGREEMFRALMDYSAGREAEPKATSTAAPGRPAKIDGRTGVLKMLFGGGAKPDDGEDPTLYFQRVLRDRTAKQAESPNGTTSGASFKFEISP